MIAACCGNIATRYLAISLTLEYRELFARTTWARIASSTRAPSFSACFAAARQPVHTCSMRFLVVGRASAMHAAACSKNASCSFSGFSRHSHAASAMPMPAAVYGPALWVTMSRIACMTSTCVRHVTNSTRPGYTRRSRIFTAPASYHATFSYCSIKAKPLSALVSSISVHLPDDGF